MRYAPVFTALATSIAAAAIAQAPDTVESRRAAAERFAELVDVQPIIDKCLEGLSDLKPEERQRIRVLLKKHLDVARLRELKVSAMASTFTTRELTAMDEFYRTPEGRSILVKYGAYLANVLPAVSEEVQRDVAEIEAEMKSSAPASAADARSQHERLRSLLGKLQAIEHTLQTQVQHLEDAYGGVDVTNMYQGIDLSTIEGIHRARQRVADCNTKYKEFAAAQERRWTDLGAMVKSNDLDEPLASGLRASFAADEAENFPNYRAWFAAARDETAAVAHLLDIAESHLGQLKWHEGRLTAQDERVATDLNEARSGIAAADRRFDAAGRTAMASPFQTRRFIGSALIELEQGRPRTD
jgi:hypothetical protein